MYFIYLLVLVGVVGCVVCTRMITCILRMITVLLVVVTFRSFSVAQLPHLFLISCISYSTFLCEVTTKACSNGENR
eukprot:m.10924 g.10924  ORF g.10924 m.10924 type:complete len:76 (+) comp3743_c0_seq1:414-641(+)